MTAPFVQPERARFRITAATLLMATGLVGCQADRHEIVGSIPDDYRTRHPIVLQDRLATLDIPVGADSGGLSGLAAANVEGFAQRFRRSGGSVIAIVAPSGSSNEIAAQRMVGPIRHQLVAAGVPAQAIDYRIYGAGFGEANAPIRLAYNAVAATTAPCGQWPDFAEKTGENRNYFNFGCATQQNLAAMVENPLDLMYPRRATPPDATRRNNVIDNYRASKPYQSDYSRESDSSLATGVGE